MNMPKRYPPDLRKLVEPRLRRLLASYVDHGHVPRCLIAFAGVGEIDFTLRLITDPDWKIMHAGMEDGLVGFAFREPGIYRWSAGDRNTAFREGDHRTRHEVSASLCLDGAAVAVLLIEFFDGEIVPKGLPWKTRKWQREIEQVLASADQEKGVIAADILLATENCVAETRSRRGFTALVRWDGTIKYFIAGDGKEKFKYLSQLEGICGEVIRSGQLLNIGYVWDHRSYRSSDDRVQSEAVMPITVDGEVVGVLNMESYVRDNYLSQDVEFMAAVAEELADLAQRYLGQGGGEIGIHSRLLSDLVEKFSIDTAALVENIGISEVKQWALGLCQAKVVKLNSILSADFIDPSLATKSVKHLYRRAVDGSGEIEVFAESDGSFVSEFEILRDGTIIATLRVKFSARPDGATVEIIGQFCRLTGNELRRRARELRALEFEQLVEDLIDRSGEQLMARVPWCLKRMLDCDDVTFLKAEAGSNQETQLVPWSTTAIRLKLNSDEPFYRATVDDGFTGFASTRRDVLVIKNVADRGELLGISRELKWERKISEGDGEPVRSFFAMPIHRAAGLVGVVRGHRRVVGSNVAFSDYDAERLRLVQFLLQRIFSSTDCILGAPVAHVNLERESLE